MASAAYGAAAAGGAFAAGSTTATLGTTASVYVAGSAWLPVVGWAVGIGAALFDTFVLMPQLRGKQAEAARPPRLLGVPTGGEQVGAPRVYALGSRVRVPCHVLWSTSKIREEVTTRVKGGTDITQRKVIVDAAISLNDRPTQALAQLRGNGALILYASKNLISVRTNRMTFSVVGARIRVTSQTTLDPEWTSLFRVGDVVQLQNWVQTTGTGLNTGYWKVFAVEPHGAAPSYIELSIYSGQVITGWAANAGNAFSPASVVRIDDRHFSETNPRGTGSAGPQFFVFEVPTTGHATADKIFEARERLNLRGFPDLYARSSYWEYFSSQEITNSLDPWFGLTTMKFRVRPGNNAVALTPTGYTPSATNAAVIEPFTFLPFSRQLLPGTFDPALYFYNGSEVQSADPIIFAERGASTPAYRGVSYQVLDELNTNPFGDSLPAAMEAVLDVDQSMDWGRAIQTIMVERCDLAASTVDVSGITQRPFLGAYLRGPVPAITAIQPILIAGQLMVQDRDGVLAFTEFANADEQSIENGATFSDFGTRLDGEAAADDKWTVEDMATEDLPTKIGIRHQDPDNQYADGYQFFGLRNPEGVDHTNEQEIDLAQMVLTRQEAANLAAVLLRRAWVNRRRYRFTLPASYIHLLESDLLTWTDDDGVPHVGRIIQRDIGSDFRVGIVCIAEDLELANYVGSPTQSAAGTPPISIPGPASLDVVIVDAPATREGENRKPGLHIAVGYNGGPWAGAAIYESVDGTSYDLVDVIGKRAVTGETTTVLASGTPAEQYGVTTLTTTAQTVEVQFTNYSEPQITSRTTKEVVSGANWVALVKPDGTTEIAAFTSAVSGGGGLFTLSGWLRGLRGTGDVAGNTVLSCPAGTRVVLLNGDTYYREFAGEISPTALAYKVVPGGLSLDDVEPILHVNARRNALPLPVRAVSKAINATTLTARFTVTHQWSRAVLPLGTQPPHPMDEPVESYRFTIYDATGTQIRRVKTITASGTGTNTIRDRWIEYTSAEQSADGYTPGPSTLFTVSVEQLGEFGAGPRWFKKF